MVNFQQRTEYLAKLMAQENINVKFDKNAPTASFDLENRTLYFPIFKDLKSAESDLIVGHEIAHALETPHIEWRKAIDTFVSKTDCSSKLLFYKYTVNMVEDARIERLVKQRYPGMKKVFHYGYDQLFNRGLFGELEKIQSMIDNQEFSLIEILNFHFKIPAKVMLKYTDEINYFIDKINATNTFGDVITVSDELYEFSIDQIKKNNSSESKSVKCFENSEEKIPEESKETAGTGKAVSGISSEENNDSSEEDSDSSSSENQPQEQFTEESSKKSDGSLEHELEKINQRNFDNNLKNFLDNSLDSKSNYYWDQPLNKTVGIAVLENIVIDYKKVLKSIKARDGFGYHAHAYEDGEEVEFNLEEQTDYYKFVKTRKNTIANYSRAFQMKKKALEFNRTLINKTGSIDSNRLAYYKTSDKVFKSNQFVAKGKNHAYIIMIDFSSSMYKIIGDVIKQTLEIVSFCRSNNIPVNVYAFSDCSSAVSMYNRTQFKHGDFKENYGFGLIELFNHKMKKSEFIVMADNLINIKKPVSKYFFLGSTPLGPALLTIPSLVKLIKSETKAEIVHCMFLTDGYDTAMVENGYSSYRRITIQDSYTKKSMSMNSDRNINFVTVLTKFISSIVEDVQLINFFIRRNWEQDSFYEEETDEKRKRGFDKVYNVKADAFLRSNKNNNNLKKEQKVLIDSFINAVS